MDKTIVEKINTDSIKLSKNAKGDYAWEVKVYGNLSTRDGLASMKGSLQEGMVVVEETKVKT